MSPFFAGHSMMLKIQVDVVVRIAEKESTEASVARVRSGGYDGQPNTVLYLLASSRGTFA